MLVSARMISFNDCELSPSNNICFVKVTVESEKVNFDVDGIFLFHKLSYIVYEYYYTV